MAKAPEKKKPSESDRIDAICVVLKANGMSLPKMLEPEKKAEDE